LNTAGSSSVVGFNFSSGKLVLARGIHPLFPRIPCKAITVSADGKFLYTLNAGTGAVGIFAIQPTSGVLTDLGTAGNLPAAAGLNGIAAN
jgi:6-phosphogluconolactonase